MLVEVTAESAPDNVGDCKLPAAFRLDALGCNTAASPSADLCDVAYDLICLGDVRIVIEAKQLQDGIEGTLSKVDLSMDGEEQCSLELDVTLRNTPAPQRPTDD